MDFTGGVGGWVSEVVAVAEIKQQGKPKQPARTGVELVVGEVLAQLLQVHLAT